MALLIISSDRVSLKFHCLEPFVTINFAPASHFLLCTSTTSTEHRTVSTIGSCPTLKSHPPPKHQLLNVGSSSHVSFFVKQYDEDLANLKAQGQRRLAERLATLVPEAHARAELRILDVACGTGLVGLHLHALGFRNIDGVGKYHTVRVLCTVLWLHQLREANIIFLNSFCSH